MTHDLTEYELSAFNRLFDKTEVMTTECIEWRGAFSANGYGAIKYKGKQRGTHQLAYELCIEEIPKGLWVLHKCDNRACVNPAHLFLGTAKINTWDAVAKDRHPCGARHGMSKLNNDKVREIRSLLIAGKLTEQAIGDRFGIAQCTVNDIKQEKTWIGIQ